MKTEELTLHIEALIFASDKPLTESDISEMLQQAFPESEWDVEVIRQIISELRQKYQSGAFAFELIQSGGGWQFLTRPEFHKTLIPLNKEKFNKKLSAAAMETLAIIAYKQPVTKSEIETIRGVNCDYTIQKLLEKNLIIISGRNEKLPGYPLLYSTSEQFMDYLGINSPADLPPLRDILSDLPDDLITSESPQEAENTATQSALEVNEGGELVEKPFSPEARDDSA
ncbi:MAG: SMC-Scp complex subunit ScpB [Chitinophagaceae bacterium]|nr:SMC-Scp complex subunit ScpB [Chitinophagaceae bacterium]